MKDGKFKRDKEGKIIKTVTDYWEEYSLVDDILKCSLRYIYSQETEETAVKYEELARNIKEYCIKRMEKLKKKCLKKTGQSIFSCLKPYESENSDIKKE